jgi:hypothetical protein
MDSFSFYALAHGRAAAATKFLGRQVRTISIMHGPSI